MLTVLTGRSRRLWPRVVEEIGEALSAGAERLLLLTPDQYTLQAELELTERLRLPGLLYLEVLSPSRLTTRVFSLAGSPERVRIDARGKAMVLSDVLRKSKGQLAFYARAAGRRGFTDRLAAAIGDLKRAGMTPEQVLELSDSLPEGDALRMKLSDIALLYGLYEERLSGAFLDGEDVQDALLQRLPASGMLSGARVWVYGFDLISPQFARQIAVMAREADSVRLALTLEEASARDGLIFQPARDTLSRLARVMDADGQPWAREHVRAPLHTAPEIETLERELFAMPQEPYLEEPKAITLWAAANPYDEAMRTAAAMRIFARGGIGFDEMAVVVGDLSAYTGAIESAFGRSDIPFHLSRQRPALWHPLLRAWLAAIRCATKGWRAEDAMDWLKGGFSGLSREEAEILETYAIEHGLKGVKWRHTIEDIALEALRDRFTAPVLKLQKGLRDAESATQSLSAAYEILQDTGAYAALIDWERQLSERGFSVEAADCAQAWRLALETLDQLHALLSCDRIPMASIAEIIESGLMAAELGAAPQRAGAVQVGQLGHFKLGGACRVLFLLGLQDGVLGADEPSLLTDAEARRAGEKAEDGATFGLRGDALAMLAQINLLDTLAAPTERLLISHSLAGVDGSALRPAAALKLIARVFPKMTESGGLSRGEQRWHAPGAALDALGAALRDAIDHGAMPDGDAQKAAAWLLHDASTAPAAERVLRALETEQSAQQTIGKKAAKKLYTRGMTSISRLESFAMCPFWHFVSYGLRPEKRREFAPRNDEIGTFYHRAMEGFTNIAAETPAWPDIPRETCDALMETVLTPLREAWAAGPLSENAMLRAAGEGFCRVARRAAWAYTDQMRRGRFRTRVIEARFGLGEALPAIPLTLPDGEQRFLEGRIDRIDFYEEHGERWLRVVDYKSGDTVLDPAKLYGGLQLQLMLYLSAALSGFVGVKAAGAFYSRFDDPLILTDSRDIDQIEQAIAKELSLSGICVSDLRAVRALEDGEALINKDGTLSKKAAAATDGELAALMRHAHALAAELSGRIMEGEIAKRPAQKDKWKACDWCDCRAACGFDGRAKGNLTRKLEKMTREELFSRVAGGK